MSGWISVKDRLPESAGLKVLVSARTVKESVLQTKAVFTAFVGYGDGKWYTADNEYTASPKIGNNEVHPVWEITHWMQMPEPPEKEDEKICGNCEYSNWDKRDKPCCHCTDKSEFVPCEE